MDDIARRTKPERRDLFLEAAARRGDMTAEIVEKDFWVCWTLKHVFELGPTPAQLVFKGGTSLSKAYGLIERFSEDIDLSLSREDLGFIDDKNPYNAPSAKAQQRRIKELVEACKQAIASQLLPGLRARFATVLGTEGADWKLALDPHDPDAQTVLFIYPAGVAADPGTGSNYVRRQVLLELGARSDHWPAEDHEVRPYAADVLPEQFRQASCRVRSLSAERTFWEKATILHSEFHRPVDKPTPERQTRHYYDLFRLYQHPVGRRALADRDLLDAVVKHKSLFFASGWAKYEEAVPGTFHLIPPEGRLADLRRDYRHMQEFMIFGDSPPFAKLLETLATLEAEINTTAEGTVAIDPTGPDGR